MTQCKFPRGEGGKWRCGSYAFNLHAEGIDQGDYCDHHYWQNKAEKAIDFVGYYANCPCCQKSDVCEESCTFAKDSPFDFEVMENAREVIKP